MLIYKQAMLTRLSHPIALVPFKMPKQSTSVPGNPCAFVVRPWKKCRKWRSQFTQTRRDGQQVSSNAMLSDGRGGSLPLFPILSSACGSGSLKLHLHTAQTRSWHFGPEYWNLQGLKWRCSLKFWFSIVSFQRLHWRHFFLLAYHVGENFCGLLT